jgi:radical SAM protein with 4Fe4S-binding SPASM domain
MYVLPFWSFRSLVGDGYVVTNHLTRDSAAVSEQFVRELAAVHEGAPEELSRTTENVARELQVLFDDKEHADRWMGAREERRRAEHPAIDQIELTNRCPYTCGMCPRTISMTRGLGDMSLDLFRRVIDQISGRQSFVALHHFGESLLHRGLAEAVAYAQQAGVRTGLSCNPPSLRPAIAESILDAGMANLVLSMDSLDPDTYRHIRGPAARADVADANVRELVRLRDAGGYDTSITLQMINMDANAEEGEAFLQYGRDVGVDRVVVIRLGKWDFPDEYIEQIGEVTAPGYTTPCVLPWSSIAVMWDGRVVPCCHDYDGCVVLGDLSRQSLQEVWESSAAEAFRAGHDESELCRNCAFSKYHREAQRTREGFIRFHTERANAAEVRMEWVNPASQGWRDGRRWFDRFDVMADEQV